MNSQFSGLGMLNAVGRWNRQPQGWIEEICVAFSQYADAPEAGGWSILLAALTLGLLSLNVRPLSLLNAKHGSVDAQLPGQEDEDPRPFRRSAASEQECFLRELRYSVCAIRFKLNIANDPVKETFGTL